MRRAIKRRIDWLRLVLAPVAIVIGASAVAENVAAQEAATTKVDGSVFKDESDRAITLKKGYLSLIQLSFVPSSISIANPEVADVVVMPGSKNPQVHLLGKKTGKTNVLIFDKSDKLQASMIVTVVDEEAGGPTPVTVFHGSQAEELRCSAGACEAVTSERGAGN